MSGVEFGALPPISGNNRAGTGKWADIARLLMARPGDWAKVDIAKTPGLASATASQVKSGRYSALPKGDFEAAGRGIEVWARYVGGAS